MSYNIGYKQKLENTVEINLFVKQNRVTAIDDKLRVTKAGSRGRMNWIRIDIYTLLYIKQVTNKNLLYSTENSTPYSVVAYMGKGSKKGVDMYICVTDHFAVYL